MPPRRPRMPPPTQEQLLAALADLRSLGFFPSSGDLSTAALLQAVQAAHGEEWAPLCSGLSGPAALDQLLVWQDRERVWSRDLEGAYPGEDAYAVTLVELAAISRGAFQPAEISEVWAAPDGPATLRYAALGSRREFVHANLRDDFIDLRLVEQINLLLGPGAAQFAVCDDFLPDGNFIVSLRPDELRRLQGERGWSVRTDWMA